MNVVGFGAELVELKEKKLQQIKSVIMKESIKKNSYFKPTDKSHRKAWKK